MIKKYIKLLMILMVSLGAAHGESKNQVSIAENVSLGDILSKIVTTYALDKQAGKMIGLDGLDLGLLGEGNALDSLLIVSCLLEVYLEYGDSMNVSITNVLSKYPVLDSVANVSLMRDLKIYGGAKILNFYTYNLLWGLIAYSGVIHGGTETVEPGNSQRVFFEVTRRLNILSPEGLEMYLGSLPALSF